MLKKYQFIAFIFIAFSFTDTSAQGCSDAGFCTMGAMKPDQKIPGKIKLHLRSVEVGHYLGFTKFGDVIEVVTADMNMGLGSKTNAQLKVPYSKTYGPLANIGGLSDLSISFTRNVLYTERNQLNVTLGGKIPTNKADFSKDGKPLPMYYQSSLGTWDIVAGLSWINRKWLFAFGYQKPLNRVTNGFTWGKWKDDPLEDEARLYPVSNKLKRGSDIMFRVERNFRFSRMNTYIGILPIYRLEKDEKLDPNTGERTKVDGSSGIALTLLSGLGYRFSVRSGLKLLVGYNIRDYNSSQKLIHNLGDPGFLARNVNADGLSRSFVTNLSYEFRF